MLTSSQRGLKKKRVMNKRKLLLLAFLTSWAMTFAQGDAASQIKNSLAAFFSTYRNPAFSTNTASKLTDVTVDTEARTVTLNTNAAFAEQPFTTESVARIRSEITQQIPAPYNKYEVIILANGAPIEELTPTTWDDASRTTRRWPSDMKQTEPWVTPLSRPTSITQGLQGRHFSVWASHGRYYDQSKAVWRWQRPSLYCTTEDIFTQSFVVPFLIPMLENAGACVFTPRERDWQRNEAIVDNNGGQTLGVYAEINGARGWSKGGVGFSYDHKIYYDYENPFESGTYRKAETDNRRREESRAVWQPALPADGRYAVYVSYVTVPGSISDAEYTVWHKGIPTKFRVNQQIGGQTWVYLGTFDFTASGTTDDCVMLSNYSEQHGIVTADAVRFGGGMGNVARGDSTHIWLSSEYPRYLEGSRYFTQWAGMPYSLYGNKQSSNDYAEDINARSLMTNKLARGSAYLPGDSGHCVPIELSLAVHSDAGFSRDRSNIGTLGIYTSGNYTPSEFEGMLAEGLLPSLRSRMMSRDLCDIVVSQVDNDLRLTLGSWNRRQMYDRNYSETRVPEVPSIILETLSHQNFADLMRGHDPSFKMLLSRAIYKGVLKYVSASHGIRDYVVQPLPVGSFCACLTANGDSVDLAWQPTISPIEPNSAPTQYIIYTSQGRMGYDNGKVVYGTRVRLPIRRGILHRYIVRAANDGGISMPSEELCAYSSRQERNRILIINNFSRLAAPQPIDTDSTRGFDFNIDPGVTYQHSSCYSGRQINFSKSGFGANDETETGFSGNELEGMIIAGNTFDYPTMHARDFMLADASLSISSCSRDAFEQGLVSGGYHAIDLVLGAQRADGYSINAKRAFTKGFCSQLADFASRGGSLLVSGAYLSEELDGEFAQKTLNLMPTGQYFIDGDNNQLQGTSAVFTLYNEPNEQSYSIRRISLISPLNGGFTSITNPQSTVSLSVAYSDKRHRTLTYGFPLECIRETSVRQAMMAASLNFILKQ